MKHELSPKSCERPSTGESKPSAVDKRSVVSDIDSGECELIGPERYLIPEGDYEAEFTHYETVPIFIKKVRDVAQGGKVYLWFRIDPYKKSQIDPRDDVRLFISYNVSSLQPPYGKNGKFKMTRGKKFVKDYERLIGSAKRRDRISPNSLKGMLLFVHVHTVRGPNEKERLPEDCHYSVIDELIKIEVGGSL